MQSLYEKKLITYPRTNSRYLSGDIDTDNIVDKLQRYETYTDKIKDNGWKIQKRSINDSKVTDHHALSLPEKPAEKPKTMKRRYMT